MSLTEADMAHIRELVDQAPALTPRQQDLLARTLAPEIQRQRQQTKAA